MVEACVGLEPRGPSRRVTPGSGRLTLGLWVRGGRGLSLSFFSAFLRVLSHSSGSSLPSSLFIRQVLGAIWMYRYSFTFLSCKSLAVSRIPTSFQSISWLSCHVCSATADLSNAPSLHTALCSWLPAFSWSHPHKKSPHIHLIL